MTVIWFVVGAILCLIAVVAGRQQNRPTVART
jgi:hypothetical protein